MIEQGGFREDLYHRINEFQLHMPLLKTGAGMSAFAGHFLGRQRQMNKSIEGLLRNAELLLAYDWRGNLRTAECGKTWVLLSEGPLVQAADLPEEIRNLPLRETTSGIAPAQAEGQDAQTLKEQHERQMITQALARTKNNRTRAARLLGIDRKTLYNKMKLYNME